MLVFDIETKPQPDDVLRAKCPPVDLSQFEPTEFDPESVKTGNMKVETAAKKIAEKQREHEAAMAKLPAMREAAEREHFEQFKSQAALSAATGEVLAVGYLDPDRDAFGISDTDNGTEAEVLTQFWFKFEQCRVAMRNMVGLNIFNFDLPFLMHRSWILGVHVPATVIQKNRYWHTCFVDLREVWCAGQYPKPPSSFDQLSRAFGTSGKPDGVTGADFALLWVEDKEAAVAYLREDLAQPAAWAQRMGIS